jgi:hypothetical protein
MNDFEPDTLARARQRAQVKLEFYKHVWLYLTVIAALGVLNLTTGPGYLWFLWPAAGWGIGIIAHAINVFVSTRNVLDRMTERELQRGQARLRGNHHGSTP